MKFIGVILLFLGVTLFGQEQKAEIDSSLIDGLKFRNIGPAFSSGRIADMDIHPWNESIRCSFC